MCGIYQPNWERFTRLAYKRVTPSGKSPDGTWLRGKTTVPFAFAKAVSETEPLYF
jgi:hypothetical protein